MGKLRYWDAQPWELRLYILDEFDQLKRAKAFTAMSGTALALLVYEHITYCCWYSEAMREKLGMKKREKTDSMWRGFVDVKLTSEEKDAYVKWDIHDDDLWLLLVDAITAGHKLSVTFNKQNDQFVASFTGQTDTGDNEGYTLSAYAKTWYDAVRVLCFKHAVLLEGSWDRAAERTTDNIG